MMLVDSIYFVIYFIILYCTILWLVVLLRNKHNFFEKKEITSFPEVSFLIPVYNEEKTITRTIESILNLDYPTDKLDIIVINDGSTDNTKQLCEGFGDKITLINQENQGKAAAMNNGLKYVNTEFVVSMDGDSEPHKDYLKKAMSGFDENTDLMTPGIKLKRQKTITQKIQWVEYLFSILLRQVFSFFDCQYVAPGPGSVYRTKVLREAGGFDVNSLTEDMEIAFKMHGAGCRNKNKPDAYVWTEAPEKFKHLFKQRVRWYRGYFQTVSKHSYMLGNKNYGNLGVVLLPLNYLWVGIMIFIGAMVGYNILKGIYDMINFFFLVDMNLSVMLDVFPSISFMNLSIHTIFMGLFMIFGGSMVYLSLKASKENPKIKENGFSYILFLVIYPIYMTIFWGASTLYELTKRRFEW